MMNEISIEIMNLMLQSKYNGVGHFDIIFGSCESESRKSQPEEGLSRPIFHIIPVKSQNSQLKLLMDGWVKQCNLDLF